MTTDQWGVRRPDGTFVPLHGGEVATSKDVAEAWEAKHPGYTAVPLPAEQDGGDETV